MPVAAPGRWVKGEAKSLLGGTRPRTPAPGESARPAENAKGAEYRSTPPIARHEGDRRGSPWFSWRAIAVGCVLGALVVLAVFRAFPSVAAAVVPTPGSAVSASWQTSQAEPSSSRAAEPSAKPAKPRTTESFADIVRAHHAKRLEDSKVPPGRRRASSDSKMGAHADGPDASLGVRKVSAETVEPPREEDSRQQKHHHHRVRRERAMTLASSASDTHQRRGADVCRSRTKRVSSRARAGRDDDDVFVGANPLLEEAQLFPRRPFSHRATRPGRRRALPSSSHSKHDDVQAVPSSLRGAWRGARARYPRTIRSSGASRASRTVPPRAKTTAQPGSSATKPRPRTRAWARRRRRRSGTRGTRPGPRAHRGRTPRRSRARRTKETRGGRLRVARWGVWSGTLRLWRFQRGERTRRARGSAVGSRREGISLRP